jgi:flagellin
MSNIIMTGYIQSALQTLLFTSDSLDKTQDRTTSGYKISSASDNASYWSVATAMTSDGSVLSSISDALSLGASKVDTTYGAVESALSTVNEILGQLTSSKEAGIDRTVTNEALSGLKDTLASLVESATFSGDNWLYNTEATAAGTKSVPGSFQRSVSGSVSLTYLDFNAGSSTLIDMSDASRGLLTGAIDANTINPDGSATERNYYLLDAGSTTAASGTEITLTEDTTEAEIDDMIGVVSAIADKLTALGATLGTMSNRIDQQSTYAADTTDLLETSVGKLIDADMEEESTKLTAYQAQRDLAVQILSMANSHQQSLAALFG